MSFYGGVLGALVRFECAKCGEVQVRARPGKHEVLRCRRCNAPLPIGPQPVKRKR